MKSSEVLRKALERMDGGKKWCKGETYVGDKCCVYGAFDGVDDRRNSHEFLRTVIGDYRIAHWNDSAPDFSVIQQGFEKAIALAEAEND